MIGKLEDLAGRIAIVVVFLFFALSQFASILAVVTLRESMPYWELVLSSRVFGLLFLCMVIVLTMIRLPSRKSAMGLEPRISAIAGTFILMALAVLPGAPVGPYMLLFSTVLIAVGTALSIYCLSWLGRSFSIMATARRLVTNGPYGVVRHPLYSAEAISVIGLLIANWSMAAAVIGAMQFSFQFRRMLLEERILEEAFPEYASYASRVPMFLPGPVFRARNPAAL